MVMAITGEMKILNLVLKCTWFDMIESGVKKEEYREIKPYWKKLASAKYDAVRFHRGYTAKTLTLRCNGIRIGRGKTAWGAPDKDVYVISLGDVIQNQMDVKSRDARWHVLEKMYDDGDVCVTLSGDNAEGVKESAYIKIDISGAVGVPVMWKGKKYDKDMMFTIGIPLRAEAYMIYKTDTSVAEMVAKYKERRAEFVKKNGIKNM